MKLRRGTNALSRLERLRGSKDFSRIFREGEKVRLPYLTLRWFPNDLPYSRVGTSVGRRFGNAVKRNRAKRILKELYRTRKHLFPCGMDLVFMPGKDFLDCRWRQYEEMFARAAEKVNMSYASRTQVKDIEKQYG